MLADVFLVLTLSPLCLCAQLYKEETDAVFRRHSRFIKAVHTRYCTYHRELGPGKWRLEAKPLLRLLKDAAALNNHMGITTRDVTLTLTKSVMRVPDELEQRLEATSLDVLDFHEFLCRIAHFCRMPSTAELKKRGAASPFMFFKGMTTKEKETWAAEKDRTLECVDEGDETGSAAGDVAQDASAEQDASLPADALIAAEGDPPSDDADGTLTGPAVASDGESKTADDIGDADAGPREDTPEAATAVRLERLLQYIEGWMGPGDGSPPDTTALARSDGRS